MTATLRRHCRLVIALTLLPALLAPLSGCGGLLSAPPERQLYRLSPTFAALPHPAPVTAQLAIALPTAPAGLDTRRIALTRTPMSLDYYADAEWTDRLPYLVQDALVAGFEKSRAVPAVAPTSLGLHADFVVETAISNFTATIASPNAPQIDVALNARLVRLPERRIIAQTTMRTARRATGAALPDVVAAFDAALGQAVDEIVGWTLRNPALAPAQAPAASHSAARHGRAAKGRRR